MSSNYIVCGSDDLVYGPYSDHATAFSKAQSLANAMALADPDCSVQENTDSDCCVVLKKTTKLRDRNGVVYTSSYESQCGEWVVRLCQQ